LMSQIAKPFSIEGFKYKYMAYGDGAKALIKNATMKFSHASEFNDPFDCFPSYSNSSIKNVIKSNPKLYKKVGESLGLSPAERIKQKGKMLKRLEESVSSGKFVESLRQDIGICSMTPKPCNLLMWAHYGDKHKGIAAEFSNEIPDLASDSAKYLFAFHVDYKDKKPVQDISNPDFITDLLVKGSDWEYENEIRVLDHDRGHGIHPYERRLLSSIILGVKFEESLKKEIQELVNDVNELHGTSIKVYQAAMVPNEFKVYIPEHPIYGDPSWK
ncbi:TPA: DUF2971 domain-containing protein, partial [Vibrio vulnificus]|nr:DUF2971 domain-containing protein [Vibrio vulnificus]